MYQYLVDHARQNVWCNPDQDNQLILAAQKLTKRYGELNRCKVMNRKIDLPQLGKRYHVFQVGQVHPNIVGLLANKPDWSIERWTSFQDAINSKKLYSSVYTNEGVYIPRFSSYYMFTNDRDLIFAVEIDRNIPIDYEVDTIFVRFYTNAFYQSMRADAIEDYLYCKGKVVLNTTEILTLQSEVADYRTKVGHTSTYCNGLLVDNIDPVNVQIGDSVEYIYDSSVKRVVTFTVNELQTFSSILDSKYKYVLHHLSGSNDTIDYQDDIDIDILYERLPSRFKGVYYHRNNLNSHRMLTHRDYSICVDYYNYIATALSEIVSETPLDIRDFKIEVKIRNSGYYRPLIFDNNRLFELYKLSSEKILRAMVGIDATVSVWRAENLENSAYTQIMRSKFTDIDIAMIQRGYGYNGISKIVGDTPTKTVLRSLRQSADLPYVLYENCTVYEYDENGLLIHINYHPVGRDYECVNNDARMIEVISGKGTYRSDVRYGVNNIPLPTYDNYRVYMCYLVDGIPDNKWTDITGSNLYTVTANTLVWNDLDYSQYLMVRTDGKFLAYDLDLNEVGGAYYFTLAEEAIMDVLGPDYTNMTLPVPLGELDIFMNGKSLIRGLDYIMKFPMVFIINKTHLNQPANSASQHLHIRYTGFCNSDLSTDSIDDFGYIEHDTLSNNNKYDIRDDRVLRITVNGKLRHRDDIIFSELHEGISIVNGRNGQPYQIKDIVVPLKELVDENTYSLRSKSLIIDKSISDYMTVKLPQPERDAPSSIYQRYELISPFISRVIDSLMRNLITTEQVSVNLSDNDVITLCAPFEELLAFDPITITNGLDHNYVIIHPHSLNTVIDLNIYQYRFLLRVVKLYGNGYVELSPFVTFTVL